VLLDAAFWLCVCAGLLQCCGMQPLGLHVCRLMQCAGCMCIH
jgi:hypothetical protein